MAWPSVLVAGAGAGPFATVGALARPGDNELAHHPLIFVEQQVAVERAGGGAGRRTRRSGTASRATLPGVRQMVSCHTLCSGGRLAPPTEAPAQRLHQPHPTPEHQARAGGRADHLFRLGTGSRAGD
jgi:hypothetical protein